jgi:hypothetical protein
MLDALVRATDARYPRAGDEVDGREVRGPIPNLSSIDGYMRESYTLPGVRVVPMSDFGTRSPFVTVDDDARSERLAQRIRWSGWIAPLIIGVDAEGPFIIEGVHRFVALLYLKASAFPALIVVGED